jgi:nucleotide-binding universal stress UspA family protein
MNTPFKKIGLAIAFSPRLHSLLAETARLQKLWQAKLILIHVGDPGPDAVALLNTHLEKVGLPTHEVIIHWRQGDPAKQILIACKEEKIDLLIAGAMKKENILKYYLGTVARKIMRKAPCSVLLLLNPSETPKSFKNIVVNAEDSPFIHQALEIGCSLGVLEKANWLHIVREVKLYGLTMSASEQSTEAEYDQLRNTLVTTEIENVQNKLCNIPHEGLKINIKILSGKSGFELAKFATRKHADLLVVGAPSRKLYFFDRIFPHDLEYIFADMPCNLLVVHPQHDNGTRKEGTHA